jgi:hypothetical protein
MANTFDTSRVGGGTYELEQDASGNYNLKSVGFTQVNKLNLPDLKTSDTTSVADTTKKATEDTIKAQTTEVFKPMNTYGGGNQSNTSTPMLKTAEVNKPTVRSAGDAMTANAQSTRQNFDQSVKDLQDKSTIEMNEAQIAKLNAEGASPQIMAQAQARLDKAKANEYDMYRTGVSGKPTGNFYQDAITRGQTGVKYQTPISPVSKATSAVQDTVSGVVDSVKNNKALQMAGTILGVPLSPLMTGAKMVAGMLPKETSTQKMNKGYFNTNEGSQRISGNPATDLYAGMNRTSDFGNLENAGNKRIATREATIARREKTNKPMSDKFKADTEKMKDQAKDYKAQKTETQKATQGPAGGGGGGGSDSGRVICTDLHRTGELSTRDWIRDTKFTFKTLSITHVKGYLLWAEPTVKHIQKYPRYRKMWKHIAQHRANDIAWRLNEGKFDLLGRIYAGIGEPLCWALGNFVSNKQINKYNLTHWRRA